MRWLIVFVLTLVAIGGLFWWAVLDTNAPPATAHNIDLAAYRALVANDAPDTLPTDVRVEEVGSSTAPSFAADAGDFSGDRTFSYVAFQVVAPEGDTIIDAALDASSLSQMTGGKGSFHPDVYARVLDAMTRAHRIMITHEHIDHVMAVARHPKPAAIAPHLVLTRAQLNGLPQYAPNGVLAPDIAAVTPIDLTTPRRLAPGIVAHATPGHSPGSIVIYVQGATHEYLFVGDIVWAMAALEHNTGRPRFIRWLMSGVDPDRPTVLAQVRALHTIAAATPGLIILPAHDHAYLQQRVREGVVHEGFVAATAVPARTNGESAGPRP